MKTKIIEHYAKNYSSSPIEISEEEIQYLIYNDCECTDCGKSIFELYDFPEIDIEQGEIYCEDCYNENYLEYCPLCENRYDIKEGKSDYFVVNKEGSKEANIPIGIYQILKRPYFYGDCVTGFDGMFNDSIKHVSKINLEEIMSIESCECICPECVELYLKKENYFMLGTGVPSVLFKKHRNDWFKDYTDENIHKTRQKVIHERIYLRGLIQKGIICPEIQERS